ncbi:MAG: hypothetical protein Q4C10_01610 [Clostridia bacterium]|nr:hypothetical protein [Clostridia bacterium]
MKTDITRIDNQGNGFSSALEETKRAAAYAELNPKNAIQLRMLTHEMLCLARSITGEMKADFWIEREDGRFDLHMTTETEMDAEKRALLIRSASSQKNEAAKGFLGRLRDSVEQALATPVDHSQEAIPNDVWADIPSQPVGDPDWDGYERSVLRSLADNVKVGIRGGKVEITVSKTFEA